MHLFRRAQGSTPTTSTQKHGAVSITIDELEVEPVNFAIPLPKLDLPYPTLENPTSNLPSNLTVSGVVRVQSVDGWVRKSSLPISNVEVTVEAALTYRPLTSSHVLSLRRTHMRVSHLVYNHMDPTEHRGRNSYKSGGRSSSRSSSVSTIRSVHSQKSWAPSQSDEINNAHRFRFSITSPNPPRLPLFPTFNITTSSFEVDFQYHLIVLVAMADGSTHEHILPFTVVATESPQVELKSKLWAETLYSIEIPDAIVCGRPWSVKARFGNSERVKPKLIDVQVEQTIEFNGRFSSAEGVSHKLFTWREISKDPQSNKWAESSQLLFESPSHEFLHQSLELDVVKVHHKIRILVLFDKPPRGTPESINLSLPIIVLPSNTMVIQTSSPADTDEDEEEDNELTIRAPPSWLTRTPGKLAETKEHDQDELDVLRLKSEELLIQLGDTIGVSNGSSSAASDRQTAFHILRTAVSSSQVRTADESLRVGIGAGSNDSITTAFEADPPVQHISSTPPIAIPVSSSGPAAHAADGFPTTPVTPTSRISAGYPSLSPPIAPAVNTPRPTTPINPVHGTASFTPSIFEQIFAPPPPSSALHETRINAPAFSTHSVPPTSPMPDPFDMALAAIDQSLLEGNMAPMEYFRRRELLSAALDLATSSPTVSAIDSEGNHSPRSPRANDPERLVAVTIEKWLVSGIITPAEYIRRRNDIREAMGMTFAASDPQPNTIFQSFSRNGSTDSFSRLT
ncbi:hypothetical protein BJ742DRAFT_852295 [Cladochytrium replicatum]|nr:hypothetical protein BJ742DRAFT_852295 [Cladochytrium replicatum]